MHIYVPVITKDWQKAIRIQKNDSKDSPICFNVSMALKTRSFRLLVSRNQIINLSCQLHSLWYFGSPLEN